MTGMPDITEGINDPYIEAGEMRHGLFRQIAHVGRIGEIPEPKPERFATPVALAKRYRLDHSARAVDADHAAARYKRPCANHRCRGSDPRARVCRAHRRGAPRPHR